MMFNYGAGASYLTTTIPASNFSIFPVAASEDESLRFTEVRAMLAQTVTRIIQRDPNTNGILGTIAEGRGILHELAKSMKDNM